MIKFKAIDGSNWLRSPWKLMSFNNYYRHYCKRTDKYEDNLVVVRTSDKCFRVERWRVFYSSLYKPVFAMYSFRSWVNVVDYAAEEVL